MEKEIKRPRADRREILRLNEKFDKLMEKYTDARALYGDTEKTADILEYADRAWKKFAHNHNKNRKNRLRADPGALMKEVENRIKQDAISDKAAKEREERAKYDRWVAKVTMRYPRLMWRWNIIAKFKKSYVKEKYEKCNGKSPKGAWL